jgi:hypothetical protein
MPREGGQKMPEEMQKAEAVGARLRQLIQAKKLEEYSCRQWRERLQKFGEAPSEATISRDLRWDTQKIPIQRLQLWAKAIGVPVKQLVSAEQLARQMLQPKQLSEKIVQSVKYWAFCPHRHCPSAGWAIWKQTGAPAEFRDYGWFNAEEEGRYCRRCGTELVKECRTSSCKKKKIENRGDLYCGTCGKGFAENLILAPYELWNRAINDDWKYYTRKQQFDLLSMTLEQLKKSDVDSPLDLTADVAKWLEYQVQWLEEKLHSNGLAASLEDLWYLVKLEIGIQKLHDTMLPLMSAVRASNKEYFVELDSAALKALQKEGHEKWERECQKKEQEKIAQGMIEPSVPGDASVEVPPPKEREIPF